MNKKFRQGQILNVIRGRSVHTQEELAEALEALGIQATQVTLSRDIRELGLVKTPDGYREIAALEEPEESEDQVLRAVQEFLLDVRQAQNLLVLKTGPANASTLAAALDRAAWPEVVGTLAGDDTVLVVTPEEKQAEALKRRLLGVAREREG
jgi:transcriptional regulator of arginine metabolism